MKNIFKITVLVLLAISCSRHEPLDSTYPWPATGVAEADSLILAFERDRNSIQKKYLYDSVMSSFRKLTLSHPDNKMLRMRNAYLETCGLSYDNDPALLEHINGLMAMCDSSSSPYDWHMLRYMAALATPDVYTRFNILVGNIAFFTKVGSIMEECRNRVVLSNLYLEMGDSVRALENLRLVENSFVNSGQVANQLITRINIANVCSDSVSTRMYREFLKDSLMLRYPVAKAIVYQNAYIHTDSLPLLDLAIRTLENECREKHNLPVCIAMKGDWYTRHGDPETGMTYLRKAFASIDQHKYKRRYVKNMHAFMAEAYNKLGMKDSCIAEMQRRVYWTSIENKEMDKPKIYAMDARSRLELVSLNAHLERTRIMLGCAVLLSLMLAVIIFMHMRAKRRRELQACAQKTLEDKLEAERRSMQALAKVMEESDKMIADVSSVVGTLGEKKMIKEEGVDEIMKLMKIYRSNEGNRQCFIKLSRDLDRHFISRLKNDFPDMPESQLQLAAMISAGLDNRQIMSVMNNTYSSVYQARWRLRTRLRLNKEDSLEDFLRRYNRGERDE